MIFWAVPLFWLACATAGYVYSLQRGIPSSVVLAALPAFLLEATFFLTLGVESWRKRLEKLRPAGVAAVLVEPPPVLAPRKPPVAHNKPARPHGPRPKLLGDRRLHRQPGLPPPG